MAALRMSLAEIRHKEEQLDASVAQFRTQLRRLPRQTIYGMATVDTALSAMGEIEERLQDAEDNRRRLLTIKKAAVEELAALESVQQVDEARKGLAQLKQQAARQPESEETTREIRRAGAVYRRTQQARRTGHHRQFYGAPPAGVVSTVLVLQS